MSTAVKAIELDHKNNRGKIILDDLHSLPDFAFDSNGSEPANGLPYGRLTSIRGVTAVSWSSVTQELLFSWARLFSGDETTHRMTALLARDFGLDPSHVVGCEVPKFPEETIVIQHPPGGTHTFVHTRVRLSPITINRTSARALSVPLFEKLRILEGVTINLHPFMVHAIAKDEQTSVEVGTKTVPNAIIREFGLQAAKVVQQ